MPKRNQQAEINNFVGGLLTEASPLNFPENFSRDEDNFVLNRDGTRDRRLGMDLEDGYFLRSSLFVTKEFEDRIGTSLYIWEGAGGDADLKFLVVQSANQIHIYNTAEPFLSRDGHLQSLAVAVDIEQTFTYATINGRLVIGTVDLQVPVVTYTEGTFQVDFNTVKTRDMWGVEDIHNEGLLFDYEPGKYTTQLVFDSATKTITGDTFWGGSLSPLSIGDIMIIRGSGNNNGEFTVAALTSTSVTVEEDIFDETLLASLTGPLGATVYPIRQLAVKGLAKGVDEDLDLYASNNINYRPSSLSGVHTYNLWNQGWGVPRKIHKGIEVGGYNVLQNTNLHLGVYPSNADVVWDGIQGVDVGGLPYDVYYPDLMEANQKGTQPAAKGYFIIDALWRGISRAYEFGENNDKYAAVSNTPTSTPTLPIDISDRGFNVVSQFAGRVFYAGARNVAGPLATGDTRSPALEHYIFFSQAVNSPDDIFKCYQAGDPTSPESSDVVDSDGGFIKISGLSNVLRMVELDRSLAIIASNGVWILKGDDNTGFSAVSFELVKVSSFGAISADSVVEAGDQIYYWGEGGIYQLGQNELGDRKVNNLTENRIQTLYNGINSTDLVNVTGCYDNIEKKIRWIYTDTSGAQKELVLDLVLNAYSTNTIQQLSADTPVIKGMFPTDPFTFGSTVDDIIVGSDDIVIGSDDVVVTSSIREEGQRELKYLVYHGSTVSNNPLTFTFAHYRDQSFMDWVSADGTGVDAAAYLLTGDATLGNSSLHKQIPYLTMHFKRTENGFEDDGFGDLTPLNPSSCQVRVRWDWSDDLASNRWSRQFQAYRYRQPYFPSGSGDTYETGYETITTKNKIRGRGKAFSMYLSTEAGKDCRLLGWSLNLNGNQHV